MKHRHFICRLIAAVIMVTSVCSSLSASAIEGISFGIGSPHRIRSSQTYTSTVSSANYVPYDTDTNITPAIVTASAETDEDAPVISLSSRYTNVSSYDSGFYLDFSVENASSYEFYSSDTSYVTVDSDGYVRVLASYYYYKSVIITLRAYYLSDTSKYVEKSVNLCVTAPTTTTVASPKIFLYDPDESDLYVGNTFKLIYDAQYYSSLQFSSSDTSIATVDSYGYVTVKSAGTVTITATAVGYSYSGSSSDSVTFTTYDPIKLSEPDNSDLFMGNTFPMEYTMDYPFDVELTWSSGDENVASVDSSGNVTVNGAGLVTITATASGNGIIHTDSVTFTVYTTLTLYSPAQSDLFVGNTIAVEYSAKNYDYIQWISSDENIASVDSSGNVTINALGTVTISAKAGGYSVYDLPYASDSVTFISYAELPLGKVYSSSVKSGDSNCFKFTAPADGAYIFESTGSCNTVGELLSELPQGSSLAYNDDGGTISNFKITYSLTKGQTVFLKVTGYNGDAVSTYDVSVVSDSGQTAAPAIIPALLTMNPGDMSNLFVINVPDGVSVQWTSDNTKVATVNNGEVTAVGEGTANIYAVCGSTLLKCSVTVSSDTIVYGDVDLDEKLTITDAARIMSYVSNSEKYPLSAEAISNADVYQRGDGLSNMDALAIQKRIAQLILSLPESIS